MALTAGDESDLNRVSHGLLVGEQYGETVTNALVAIAARHSRYTAVHQLTLAKRTALRIAEIYRIWFRHEFHDLLTQRTGARLAAVRALKIDHFVPER